MKELQYYMQHDLSNAKEVFDYLIMTLKDSIFTWDYFVDFGKSIKNIKDIKDELSKLNSLIGINENSIDNSFIELLECNPEVRKVLPILIALRINKLNEMPIIDDIKKLSSENKKELFSSRIKLTPEISDKLLTFFELSGLREIFVNKEITNVIDYCIGIEVGMDTNARKNRTGTTMEDLLEDYLRNFCDSNGCKYIRQATKNSIFNTWSIDIEVDKINRRFDFAVLNRNNQLFLIEANYYGSGGSKLKATAGEYKYLHEWVLSQGFSFIWITDGLGWNTAKTALNETFISNDYVLNLHMISEGILDEIINC